MVDIELTNIETVSQRSLSGLLNEDDEDELSIKKLSLDEHKSLHTLPSNIPESTLDNLASSVVAQSVERISQNDDDNLITLPYAKIKEWLKHGIQILRESRQRRKTAGSDSEYEAFENDSGLEYLDQPNVEVFSSRSRVSGAQSDGQLCQQYSNNPSREFRNQPWFTTAQGEMVDKFLNTARRNPFRFREISAEQFNMAPKTLDVSQSEFEKRFHYIDIEYFLALKLSELIVLVHFCTQEVNPPSKELDSLSSKFLTIDDLNAGSLAEIGGIKLGWTNVTEEHFLLNRDTGELLFTWIRYPSFTHETGRPEEYQMTKLSVFEPKIGSESEEFSLYGLDDEIRRAWAMLHSNLEEHKGFTNI
ncbi:hypothetical protein ACHAP3_002033 [Botrytis cinerea]